MQPTFIDPERVAQRLGLPNAAAFLRRRIDLEDRFGFPVPVPHWKRPLKWRADQVEAWLECQGLPRASDPDDSPRIDPALLASGQVVLMSEARRP